MARLARLYKHKHHLKSPHIQPSFAGRVVDLLDGVLGSDQSDNSLRQAATVMSNVELAVGLGDDLVQGFTSTADN